MAQIDLRPTRWRGGVAEWRHGTSDSLIGGRRPGGATSRKRHRVRLGLVHVRVLLRFVPPRLVARHIPGATLGRESDRRQTSSMARAPDLLVSLSGAHWHGHQRPIDRVTKEKCLAHVSHSRVTDAALFVLKARRAVTDKPHDGPAAPRIEAGRRRPAHQRFPFYCP